MILVLELPPGTRSLSTADLAAILQAIGGRLEFRTLPPHLLAACRYGLARVEIPDPDAVAARVAR